MANVITSVSDYLEKLKTIAVDGDSQLFYRGVSNEEYATPENNIPSIYRNKGWIENEDKMFYELVSRVPEEFKDCQNTFEYLVKMQHYGYPTRLLDITSNPLIALYFACAGDEEENKKNGQVVCFHIKKNEIRNYESDRVALLSNLVKSDYNIAYPSFLFHELKEHLLTGSRFRSMYHDKRLLDNDEMYLSGIIIFFSKDLTRLMTDLWVLYNNSNILNTNQEVTVREALGQFRLMLDETIKLHDIQKESQQLGLLTHKDIVRLIREMRYFRDIINIGFMKEVQINNVNDLVTFLDDARKNIYLSLTSNSINSDSHEQYCSNIRAEKINFNTSLIVASDLMTIQCVHPKQNNPRIISQQGAFLLFGFKDQGSNKINEPVVNGNIDTIKISVQYKKEIRAELKLLGISNATLFPEIENITNELKDTYRKD